MEKSGCNSSTFNSLKHSINWEYWLRFSFDGTQFIFIVCRWQRFSIQISAIFKALSFKTMQYIYRESEWKTVNRKIKSNTLREMANYVRWLSHMKLLSFFFDWKYTAWCPIFRFCFSFLLLSAIKEIYWWWNKNINTLNSNSNPFRKRIPFCNLTTANINKKCQRTCRMPIAESKYDLLETEKQ